MSRFALFAGASFYPLGGWEDFRGTYETEREALEAAANLASADWWQIVDLETGRLAISGKRS